MLIVIRRLAIIFAIVGVKTPFAHWRPLLAKPDISASGLWLGAFLGARKDFVIGQPGGFFHPFHKRSIAAHAYASMDLRVAVPLHASMDSMAIWAGALHQGLVARVM
jgi:hypothetical protein